MIYAVVDGGSTGSDGTSANSDNVDSIDGGDGSDVGGDGSDVGGNILRVGVEGSSDKATVYTTPHISKTITTTSNTI